jgi:hypothetical protein
MGNIKSYYWCDDRLSTLSFELKFRSATFRCHKWNENTRAGSNCVLDVTHELQTPKIVYALKETAANQTVIRMVEFCQRTVIKMADMMGFYHLLSRNSYPGITNKLLSKK